MPPRSFWGTARSPLEGLDAVEQYTSTHWGREPRHVITLATPALTREQPLVAMGKLRALWLALDEAYVEVIEPPKPYPTLAFGKRDNRLYIAGGCTAAMARRRAWGPVGSRRVIVRVDYDAKKGSRRATVYFYHDHERPYPQLQILPSGYPAYRGGRYKVAPEGITG